MADKARIIQAAMQNAARLAFNSGITDQAQIRAAMRAARQLVLANWIGEEQKPG